MSSTENNTDPGGANPAIHGAGGDPKNALGAGPDPVAVSPTEISIIVVTVVVFLLGMLLVLWCHQRKKAQHQASQEMDDNNGSHGGIPLQHKDVDLEAGLSRVHTKDTGMDVVAAVAPVREERREVAGESMEEQRGHYDPTKNNH